MMRRSCFIYLLLLYDFKVAFPQRKFLKCNCYPNISKEKTVALILLYHIHRSTALVSVMLRMLPAGNMLYKVRGLFKNILSFTQQQPKLTT